MLEIKVSQVTEIENSELREIAMRVFNTMQLAAEKATAHQAEPATYPISSDPNSFEQLFLSRFQQLRPEQQQAGISKVMAAINAPEAERIRIYGDLAKVDLRSETAVEKQIESVSLSDSLEHLQSETNTLSESPSQLLSRTSAGLTHKLELRIHQVKCIVDTNEWPGRDEIDLGGSTVDESGNTEKISSFRVGEFKRGTEVNYSPPRIFATFDLLKSPGVTWPRSYFTTLVLAEIDWGGFGDFLNKLLDKIKEEVIKALTLIATALGTTIGAMIGSGIPILGTTIGAAIGAVMGWVVGKIFAWLKSLWSDEIFPPITLRADIPSINARWNGKSESPEGDFSVETDGGKYELSHSWHIEVPPTAPAVSPNGRQVSIVAEDGHLYARWLDGTQWRWAHQGNPSSSAFVTAPAVSTDAVRVFVTTADGRLYLNWWDGTQAQWNDEGMPSGARVVSAPTVTANGLSVFVIAENGHLYAKWWDGTQLQWAYQGNPSGTTFVEAPATNADGGRVFVTAANGRLYLNWWDGTQWQWNDEGMPPSGTRVVSAPAVQADGGKVFVVAEDGHLYAKWWDGTQLQWAYQGNPSGTTFVTAPAVNADGDRVFVTAANGRLYLNWWDGTQWQWNDEGMPPSGTRVVSSPAVQANAGAVFVITEDGHLYSKWWNGTQLQWADQGRP